jgi:hypothetical protein
MNTFYLVVVMSCFVRLTVCSLLCVSVSVCVCVASSSTHLIPPHERLSLTPESNSLLQFYSAFHKNKSLLNLNYTQLASFFNNSDQTCFLLFQNTPFSLPNCVHSFASYLFCYFCQTNMNWTFTFKDSALSRTKFPLIRIFEICLSPSECPIQCFHLWILTFVTYMARWEYQQSSLAVLQPGGGILKF